MTHDEFLSKEETNYSESLFESIKHINEYGQEFWYARDLQVALEYSKWENFHNVVKKAIEACKGSDIPVSDHFAEVRKTIPMPKNAEKDIVDYQLSRYACYLIVQRGAAEA